MKSIFLSACILILAITLKAQTGDLLIKNNGKGPYVEHKVAPKENFYSIGRLFFVHPKHLATFNSLDMAKGLSLGQTIRIPLTDTNFNQKSDKGVPVFYVAGSNESLYKISTNNNVLLEKVRKWNHLTNDKIASNSKLIVGFLVSGETQTVAVNNTQKLDVPAKITPDVPAKDPNKKDASKNEVVNKPDQKKEDTRQDKIDVKKDITTVPVKEEPETKGPGQGYFKTSFEKQVTQQPISKEQTITSGIFKTSSGWEDDKYYLLMNGAEPGTIIKITNPSNNKIIYAKLLGEMTDVKQSAGLNIRISNAAAAALDISETDKFIVKLNY